jgi:hypothetical protein
VSRRRTGPSVQTRGLVTGWSERFGYPRCEKCGKPTVEQIHHRRPRSSGGSTQRDTNRPSNLLALCSTCHERIERSRDASYSYGWLVRQSVAPVEMPVLIHDLGWTWLRDDAHYLPTGVSDLAMLPSVPAAMAEPTPATASGGASNDHD